ncbi:RebB family R body protein [Pyxidicoccus parkwayensis]|uniref:RebB family R body protein n=1 Tax=Pyxidicoccus parkwayensis TaxID=2813578 RepID=A0ABX7NSU0_9BACT|nr:RebB family R body protein [Pyxidicoccus parkwaysis]QSQ21960.1 RebB family R body protein [Pyxidicoccus parkwaysis]
MSDEEIDIYLSSGRRRRGDREPHKPPKPCRPRPERSDRKHVASQVTDAVTTTHVQVVAEAPAMSLGEDFLATSQALALAAQQATTQQAAASTLLQATTAQGAALLLQLVPPKERRRSSASTSPKPAKRG